MSQESSPSEPPPPQAPSAEAPSDGPARLFGLPLHTWMFIGLLAGGVAGLVANQLVDPEALKLIVTKVAVPIGQMFLRLIFMVVVPLIVSSLMLSVVELGDLRTLGRMGARTLAYTVVASGVSVFLGVGLVNLIRPGERVDEATRAELLRQYAEEGAKHVKSAENPKGLADVLVGISELIPRNPLRSATEALEGEMLALMLFSLLFGAALGRVRDAETEPVVGVLRALQRASLQLIGWAMLFAPVGVFALVFSLTARTGFSVLGSLGSYALTVVIGLAIHLLVVYGAVLRFLTSVSPVEWFRRCREVMLTAFSTSSSNATLPVALRTSAERLGIDPKVGTFVLTVGATGNQNGTALFEGITVLFLAQVFGVQLGFAQQVVVVVMSVLAGVGTAGVPGGSLPLIVVVLQQVGVPPEGIAIIIGINHPLDMARTVVNVVGDLVCATFVAEREGALRFGAITPS